MDAGGRIFDQRVCQPVQQARRACVLDSPGISPAEVDGYSDPDRFEFFMPSVGIGYYRTESTYHIQNRWRVSKMAVTIKDVEVIVTQPAGSRLVIVKVITSEPGLYGLGCATFTQRCHAVVTAIEKHLKPFRHRS